jgi:hypothetical protein
MNHFINKKFVLARTALATLSFEDGDATISRFHNYTWDKRLKIANRLIVIAYNFSLENPPTMDKTVFEIHQHNG